MRYGRLLRLPLQDEKSSVPSHIKFFESLAAWVRQIEKHLRPKSFQGHTGTDLEHIHVQSIRTESAVVKLRTVARPARRAGTTCADLPAGAGDIRIRADVDLADTRVKCSV